MSLRTLGCIAALAWPVLASAQERDESSMFGGPEPVADAPYCFAETPLTAVRGLGSPEGLRSKRSEGVLFV